MTRIYVPLPLSSNTELTLPEAAARHVAQVLRMRAGEALTLFNGGGGEYDAVIETAERRVVSVRVGELRQIDRESMLAVTLAQCVSKGERMDYTIQKAVELGVTTIIPLLSARSVVKLDGERWEKKLEHWRGIAVSACEQSGRTRIPTVLVPQKLAHWLDAPDGSPRLVLAPTAAVSLTAVPAAAAVSLLVGPEGGLSDEEIAAALRSGCTAITLGPRVLRTETAGVAALAVLQALWGDLAQ
ncbi:MAG: 16S rRNA (uracil(1498)-N(3))-methyltransferase [Nevskia sp.]|nr:16S rRNA (uracil(1498)-N(3))-methyltransferase [Nevskia sp.]MCK9383242.1 16S rRNA (uracil(1498)-N(3))-methyltransferase [Nevskia sp.]